MNYLAYKNISLSFLLLLSSITFSADVLVRRSGDTLFFASNLPNIPVNIKVISNNSRKTLFNKFIGRKQALIIPSLEVGSYELVITPTVNKKIMRRSSATSYCQGDCSGPDLETKGFPVSRYIFKVENDTKNLEIFIFPKKKLNRYSDESKIFSMGIGEFRNKKIEVIQQKSGYFYLKGIKKIKIINKKLIKRSKVTLEGKLLQLKDLQEKNLISEENYMREVERLLNENF
jgi:hypothetical protein